MKVRRSRSVDVIAAAMTLGFMCAPLFPQSKAHAEDSKTYVMKLSTATLNDTQTEWLQRFAIAVEKDSGGRIKSEIYPASQLGSIPRQIEGTQFGSIQGWVGPPEFLVGVDARFESLSAPGLFTSREQDLRVINDPAVNDMILGLGANKGLIGMAIMLTGPSAIVVGKPIHHLAEFKGMKIRVLASPFQLEMIKRMDASPVAMSLGDVLPALQQGAIDGALGTIPVFGPLHYVDAAKYAIETDQPYVNVIIIMNRKWVEALPPDLQTILHDEAKTISHDIIPFVDTFFQGQRKAWTDKGGELISLPAAEQAELVARISSIGNDVSADKPELNKAVSLVFESAKRNK
jgi:TRAP-type C4-dicarboxylate transport system substrate-binding protein